MIWKIINCKTKRWSRAINLHYYMASITSGEMATVIGWEALSAVHYFPVMVGDVLKVLSDLDISKGRQSIVLSAKWLVVV
jgi:hypothetical protein